MERLKFEDLTRSTHDEVRSLILAGLGDHWGTIDEALNPDLDDMLESYASGHTVVARGPDGAIVGTGTVVLRTAETAEIVRMSVDTTARRSGVGRQIVETLVETARGWDMDAVVLETTSTWSDVVAFYLSCGFEITHVADSPFGTDTWFRLQLR